MLDRYGILECKDTFMEELSFGQKKKIHIIRMFLMQKDVYLWDEPDSGLDEATKKWFIQSMQLLGGSHMLVSHEKDLYDTCTDKKILIH